jgi:transposase
MALTLEADVRQEIERRRRKTHDKRIAQRLSAVLWVAEGRIQSEVADLLGVTERQVRKWLRTYRTKGLEALCTLHHRGDPGTLRPAQIARLKTEIATGRFLTAQQICDWIDETFHVTYTPRGVRDLLHRIGVSYHKATGFFWKANPAKQEEFIHKYEQDKPKADGRKTRRYFVDACHPIWGVEMLYCCWLLVGQRFLVGVGGGRKRLNVLGGYCPEDHEYLDIRLTRDNINGQQFVNFLRLLRAAHPETERFILYLDNAKYYHAAVVKEWLARHPEFHLEPLPAYSPNLNLIERLWKFLRKKAFTRWHQTFEDMEAAVSAVLDHLEKYREELTTLMTEKFQRHPHAKDVAKQTVAA